MSLSSILDIACIQSCYRSKPPRLLKTLPNWKNVNRKTRKISGQQLQPIPVMKESPITMEEEEEEDDDYIIPVLHGYRKERPRPLPCWGRGVLRTPVSDLPDFTGVEEVDRQVELQAMRAAAIGRGRGRARNRGAGSNKTQSTIAPDVNMQNIRRECQTYLANWNTTDAVQKKPVRSPRSQSMLSDPSCYLENHTSHDTVLTKMDNNHFNNIEASLPIESNSGNGSPTNVIVEFPQTPSPETTSEKSFCNDYSLQSSVSDVSNPDSFLGRPLADNLDAALSTVESEVNNSFDGNSIKTLVFMDNCENHSSTNGNFSETNDESRPPSLPATERRFSTDSIVKSFLLTVRKEETFMLDSDQQLENEQISESTPQKSSSESNYSTCESVKSTKLRDKRERDSCRSSVDQTDAVSTPNRKPLLKPYKTTKNSADLTDNNLVPSVYKKQNDVSSSSFSSTESDESPSIPYKKSCKTEKNNDFDFKSRRARKAFVPNIRNSVSSSSSVEENIARKCRNTYRDTPQWDPTAEIRTGPPVWNKDQDFPQLSSPSQNKVNSSFPAAGASMSESWSADKFLGMTSQFLSNKNESGPSSTPGNSESACGMVDFLKVMSGVKQKEYRTKFDNIPNGVTKQEIEMVLKSHEVNVYDIVLGPIGNCQHAIVKCDRADLSDFFDGTAPFGASVGDLRCELL